MRWMILILILLPSFAHAGCDDQPSSKLIGQTVILFENLEAIGVGMANAKMSGLIYL